MAELVVAYGLDRSIGMGGDLPWRRDLPADLQRFRHLTVGKSAIMGYATYRSIGRPLAERENIVLTSRRLPCGVVTARSLDEAYEKAEFTPVIIGGERVYRDALHTVDVVHATEVQASFPGSDTHFPLLPDDFAETAREIVPADEHNRYNLHFVTYTR